MHIELISFVPLPFVQRATIVLNEQGVVFVKSKGPCVLSKKNKL